MRGRLLGPWAGSLLAAALLATACTSPGGHTAAHRPSASPNATEGAIAREAKHPDPNFDFGFTIQVTPAGFHPAWLVAACCRAVTWRNLTTRTITIAFDHQLVQSPPVAPGGAFVWTPPHIESINYHAVGGPPVHGVLQIIQTFES